MNRNTNALTKFNRTATRLSFFTFVFATTVQKNSALINDFLIKLIKK